MRAVDPTERALDRVDARARDADRGTRHLSLKKPQLQSHRRRRSASASGSESLTRALLRLTIHSPTAVGKVQLKRKVSTSTLLPVASSRKRHGEPGLLLVRDGLMRFGRVNPHASATVQPVAAVSMDAEGLEEQCEASKRSAASMPTAVHRADTYTVRSTCPR